MLDTHMLSLWSAPESARESAGRLALDGVRAVVTGQQAGIAGGPLYTLYKAEGTVARARELQAELGVPVVPVFWVEGDDHDFEEIRSVGLFDPKGEYRRVTYGEEDGRKISIARRTVDEVAFDSFLDEMFATLGTTDFSDELRTALRDSYLADLSDGSRPTLVDGFARFLYRLLPDDTPLVLVSSDDPELKSRASGPLEKEALDPEGAHRAVVERTEEMRRAGEITPIDPTPGHLFLQHEGERLQLDVEGEGYRLRGTDTTFTREEVAAIARDNPRDLSPNVVLRPIVQDTLFPTAIYVGGPTELAYQRQLSKLYQHHGLVQPSLEPRPSHTIVEPKVERTMKKDGVTLEQLLSDDFDPTSHAIDAGIEERIESLTAATQQDIDAVFERIASLADEIDPTLRKATGAAGARATKEAINTLGRLRGSLKKSNATTIDRLSTAIDLLRPSGKPQERMVGVPYYWNRYGKEIFDFRFSIFE